jgi:DNA modification methylase
MIDLRKGNCVEILKDINLTNAILVSDPPFNNGYKYKSYKDKLKKEEYYNLIKTIFKDKKTVIIHYPEQMHEISITFGYAPLRSISWVYNSNTPKQHREIAFYNISPNMKQVIQSYKNLSDKRIQERIKKGILGGKLYDWWNINQVKNVSKDKTNHPCQMPLEVMENIIGILPKDATIVDPFMGSGTTGLAVITMNKKQNANRSFIGIELDEEYFNISKSRIKEEDQQC